VGAPRRFTVAQVVEALNTSHGMVYLAARLLGCCPNTVYNYAERHAKVKEAIHTRQGERLDEAELALLKAVRSGEAWAVCFTLKCLGKKRGFIERPAYQPTQQDEPKPASIIDQIQAMDATILPPGQVPSSNGNGHAANGNGHHKMNGNGKAKKNGKAASKNGNGKA